jgi:catechol 2,3-dioxygenase-like lactoylglutathione lyase family enzyme
MRGDRVGGEPDAAQDRPIRTVVDLARTGARIVAVLGHLGINVADLEVARAYYDELMPMLDFETFIADDDQHAYRPAHAKPGTYLFLYAATSPQPYDVSAVGLQHLAFMVPSRQSVVAVHRRAVELGSVELHAPQVFPQYPQPYFAAFWRDPFGITLEAVCHHDR